MGQGSDNQSVSVQAQQQRWDKFVSKWEMALDEGRECIVMGDVNLDFLKWDLVDLPSKDNCTRLRALSDIIFSRIFPHGVVQLVTTATRVSPRGPDSGLDHVYTNNPQKCSDIVTEFCGGSDYKLLRFTRFTKIKTRAPKYITKRSFKQFNSE